MVTESQAYIELIGYFTENVVLFEQSADNNNAPTVGELIETQISENVMAFFEQNPDLPQDVRLDVVREADTIVVDLEEFLSRRLTQKATQDQQAFIVEFAALIKNLFDSAFI
ncbi:DUF3802 family protein [Catenovulum sp. 2E275]|uniref:DUF3802 family protein n=1 Tax=Catenovulum sp. 2E275 TaxID=2980497 RepID=UPI0021D22F14|nr:DUF3802 family protein [Catenovulum sp. 2E275]MCU4675016.1 DUF3802 family protein [Catenovulum sp. 2E275]